MFVVLNVLSSGKKKIRKGKTVDNIKEIKTGGGDRFYIVDVLDSENGINWDEVAAFIGKHSARLLMDKSIGMPENCIIKRYDSVKFRNQLMFNTLNVILKQLYLSGCRTKCYINDPRGEYASRLSGIVQYSAETVVVTKNEYRYFSHIQSLYDNFGAGIVLTDKLPQPEAHAFVIDTDGSLQLSAACKLFSSFNGIIPGTVDGYDDIKRLCPEYIDETDFLSAVYEFNRESRLKYALCSSMSYYGREMTVYDLAMELEMQISLSADRRKSIIFYV